MEQKKKLNELIEAIHEKDDLLESQEDFLIKENKKHVKLKNSYAQEVEKCENLTNELSICHDSIISLRNENASLNAKIDELNICIDKISNIRTKNDSLISKIKKFNVCNDSISCLRDENARLNSKIEELRVFYIGLLSFATVLVATLSFSSCSVLPNATSLCSKIRLVAVSVHSNVSYRLGPLQKNPHSTRQQLGSAAGFGLQPATGRRRPTTPTTGRRPPTSPQPDAPSHVRSSARPPTTPAETCCSIPAARSSAQSWRREGRQPPGPAAPSPRGPLPRARGEREDSRRDLLLHPRAPCPRSLLLHPLAPCLQSDATSWGCPAGREEDNTEREEAAAGRDTLLRASSWSASLLSMLHQFCAPVRAPEALQAFGLLLCVSSSRRRDLLDSSV
jgi:hypothetical protein